MKFGVPMQSLIRRIFTCRSFLGLLHISAIGKYMPWHFGLVQSAMATRTPIFSQNPRIDSEAKFKDPHVAL